jgi:hypothetical protein
MDRKAYAVLLNNGEWATNQYWHSTPDPTRAKIWSKIGTAKSMITRHNKYRSSTDSMWKDAKVVEFCMTQVPESVDVDGLLKFYQADGVGSLVGSLAYHIERLQNELRKFKPKSSIGPSFVREG